MGKTSKAEKRRAEMLRLCEQMDDYANNIAAAERTIMWARSEAGKSAIFNHLLLDELQGYSVYDYDADKMREARNKLHPLLDKKLSDCEEQADDV